MTYQAISSVDDTTHEIGTWPAFVVTRDEIEASLHAAKTAVPNNSGRREVRVTHPSATGSIPGLAPGIEVLFGVLNPGETTRPKRTNASQFLMLLSGEGCSSIGNTMLQLAPRDAWNVPGMALHTLTNVGDEPLTYVAYSNASLLNKLEALYIEFDPPTLDDKTLHNAVELGELIRSAREFAGTGIVIGADGAQLLPYEHLIDPEFIPSEPLHWPWKNVEPHLPAVRALGEGYNGRPLWCYYNPATGIRNGTTGCFFATIAAVGPNLTGPIHRHVSSAINYILSGSGWSTVAGNRVSWEAGDIMLSAPGWANHGHATGVNGAEILTVQDHPLHIAADSLIWQEDLQNGPILSLGAQRGFQTNLAEIRNT
jgi:gentisate 1,2-dioxygenase